VKKKKGLKMPTPKSSGYQTEAASSLPQKKNRKIPNHRAHPKQRAQSREEEKENTTQVKE